MADEPAHRDPDEALRELKDGNRRYAEARAETPHRGVERAVEVSKAQHPFGQVLACSDSRVVPEIVFDQGLGDLFVVRVAGNIVDPAVEGSLEFGAQQLGARLIVVLGHRRCGAVTAAVQKVASANHIRFLMDRLQPALDEVRDRPGDPVENAVHAQVEKAVDQLRQSEPTLAHLRREGQLKVVGAVYDLDTGRVEWTRPEDP